MSSMTHRLLLVAFSISSSKAALAPEDHQDIISSQRSLFKLADTGVKRQRDR